MENIVNKRVVSCICALVLMFGLMMSTGLDTKASDNRPMLDGSYLTNETESIGTDTKITRGEHLQYGYSKIRKTDPGVIYVGGTTVGEHVCESIQVSVIVQRAKWEDEDWEYVASFHKENNDEVLVSVSEKLEVEGGWYYRVMCFHSADGDMSDSVTDGLYVEKP